MNPKTLIVGREVWFEVCSMNDCHASLIGPWFSEEDARIDANVSGCENAHFIVQHAISHMQIHYELIMDGLPDDLFEPVLDFCQKHNKAAGNHPMHTTPFHYLGKENALEDLRNHSLDPSRVS